MAPKRIYLQWHGDGDPADEGEIDEAAVTWSRHREFEHDIRYTRTDIFMDAIARAEAAEKRVQELEAQLLGFEMAQETLVIDLRRIAERIGNPQDEWYGFGPIVENIHTGITKLESQLAAQAWRPVTEPPTDNGDYLVYCWPWEYEVMTFWDGYWAGGIPVTHWQPLPAPPQDTPTSGRHEPAAQGQQN